MYKTLDVEMDLKALEVVHWYAMKNRMEPRELLELSLPHAYELMRKAQPNLAEEFRNRRASIRFKYAENETPLSVVFDGLMRDKSTGK